MVTLFGLSSGRPRAGSQMSCIIDNQRKLAGRITRRKPIKRRYKADLRILCPCFSKHQTRQCDTCTDSVPDMRAHSELGLLSKRKERLNWYLNDKHKHTVLQIVQSGSAKVL
jgi:hypothetical protein